MGSFFDDNKNIIFAVLGIIIISIIGFTVLEKKETSQEKTKTQDETYKKVSSTPTPTANLCATVSPSPAPTGGGQGICGKILSYVGGTTGKDGINGKDGKDGLNGKDGVDGKDGIQGPPGPPGPPGPAGDSGDAGDDGDDEGDSGDGGDEPYGPYDDVAEDGVNVRGTVDEEISISDAGTATLSGTILSISGGSADTTAAPTQWTVTGGDSDGWTLHIKTAAGDGKLCKGGAAGCAANKQFVAYTPATAGTPDYNWSVASNAAEFGFAPHAGTKIHGRFLVDGSNNCNNGGSTLAADHCWYNLDDDDVLLAEDTVPTGPSGVATSIVFKAESKTYLESSEDNGYYVTVTATASVL